MRKAYLLTVGFMIVTILVACLIFLSPSLQPYINDPVQIKLLVAEYGNNAPFIMVTLHIFQVFLPIVPGQILQSVSGFLFGFALGSIYSIVGTILGSLLVFFISRKLGHKYIAKLVGEKELLHFNVFVKKRGKSALVISRFVPFFPNYLICLLAGISKINTWEFIYTTFIGILPGVLLFSYFGQEMSKGLASNATLLFTLILLLSSILYIFRHELKLLLIKEIHDIEGGVIKMEHGIMEDLFMAKKKNPHKK